MSTLCERIRQYVILKALQIHKNMKEEHGRCKRRCQIQNKLTAVLWYQVPSPLLCQMQHITNEPSICVLAVVPSLYVLRTFRFASILLALFTATNITLFIGIRPISILLFIFFYF